MTSRTEPAAKPQRKGRLKNGAEPHQLTAEDRRRGAATTNALRKEQAKTFRQRLADKLDDRADEIIDRLLDASEEDWRAITAALDQAYGKPTERHEHTGADGQAIVVEDRSASLDDLATVLRDVGALDTK